MKYYLIAGEASGDMHGSLLMKALAERDPEAEFRFWGGGMMEAAGGTKVRDYRDTAVMGVVELAAKAGRLKRNLAFCKADILAWRPDVLILIDYPGFNLKMARFAHNNGFKVFYYIAPKVWATREGRLEKLRRYVDALFVIFPFEVEWFRQRGIEPVYEGNPLIDSIDASLESAPSKADFCAGNGLDPQRPLLALLAGSRLQEIKYLAPRFVRLAALLEGDSRYAALKDAQLVLAAAPGIPREVYESHFGASAIRVVYDQTYHLLKNSDAALVASGTASLETALIGTPQVVCYGMNPLTFKLAMAMLKVRYVSLANLILDKLIFKELLQNDCNPEAMAGELLRLAEDSDCRSRMLADYAQVRAALGGSGAAGRIAAQIYSRLNLTPRLSVK